MTETSEARILHLQGDQVRGWLAEQAQNEVPLRVYRYRPNKPGLWALAVVATLCLVGILVLVLRAGPMLPIQWVASLLLASLATWAIMSVIHWGFFTVLRYIAMSTDALLIGRGKNAIVFPVSRLNRDSLLVDKMRNGARITLPVELDGVTERIHLVGAFALLEDLNQFIADILALVATDEELEAAIAEDENPPISGDEEPT
jgi:hypothetical protein